VPAGRAQPANHARARSLLVEVHRLRIKLGGKGLDFFRGHAPRAVIGNLAGTEIFPIKLGHTRSISKANPTEPLLAPGETEWKRALTGCAQVCRLACFHERDDAVSASFRLCALIRFVYAACRSRGGRNVRFSRPVPVGTLHYADHYQGILLARP